MITWSDALNVYAAWSRTDRTQPLGQFLMNALVPNESFVPDEDNHEAFASFCKEYVK